MNTIMYYRRKQNIYFSVKTFTRTRTLVNVHYWLILDQWEHRQIELITTRSYAHHLMATHKVVGSSQLIEFESTRFFFFFFTFE